MFLTFLFVCCVGDNGWRHEAWPHCPFTGSFVDPLPSEALLRLPPIPQDARGRDAVCEGQGHPAGMCVMYCVLSVHEYSNDVSKGNIVL